VKFGRIAEEVFKERYNLQGIIIRQAIINPEEGVDIFL
jgi:hypothetical protein